MFGKSVMIAAMMLCASSAATAAASLPAATAPAQAIDDAKPTKRRRRVGFRHAPRYRRSKNPPTKRRLKLNRLTIGKRVRRKHRRAA